MFKLTPDPQFQATIRLTVPGAAPVDTQWRCAHKGKQALADWLKSSADGKSDLDALSEVLVGWEGVTDDAGAPVSFSRDALAALLDQYPASAGELFAGYYQALTESRTKN